MRNWFRVKAEPESQVARLVTALVQTNEQLCEQNSELHSRLMATLTPTAFDVHAAADIQKTAANAAARGRKVQYTPPPDTAVEIQTPIDGGALRE